MQNGILPRSTRLSEAGWGLTDRRRLVCLGRVVQHGILMLGFANSQIMVEETKSGYWVCATLLSLMVSTELILTKMIIELPLVMVLEV